MNRLSSIDYEQLNAMMGPYMIVSAIIGIFAIVCGWIINVKAGKPGWAAIIPIYNIIVFLQICERPWWWLLLLLIPLVDIVILIILLLDFVKVFGKPGWHFILMLFFSIFYMAFIAFSKNVKYVGKQGKAA
jgi:phosphoglycerol transferase MdoB-like AlkP superfamily enzyme